jgi:hypothetical protein
MNDRPTFEDRLDDWLEDGPADAPDQLLDTVMAAIPSIPQRRGVLRFPWRTSPMYGFARFVAGVAVAIAVGGAALLIVTRPAPGGIGDRGSPPPVAASATPGSSAVVPPPATPVPTPAPTPSPKPTGPTISACDPAHLAARITLWEGAAGHRIAHVELTNTSARSCTTRALDKPQLVDGHGSVLIDGTAPGASKTLTVAAGGTLKTLVQDGNYCGPAPVAPVTVAFVLSNGGRFVATPFSKSDATVPPCLGAAGSKGDIEMQPWAP